MSELRGDDIQSKEVITEDGHELGSVKDLVVNIETWAVPSIVVKLKRDVLESLNLKKPLVGSLEIVIAAHDVSGIAGKVVLSKKLEEFKQINQGSEG